MEIPVPGTSATSVTSTVQYSRFGTNTVQCLPVPFNIYVLLPEPINNSDPLPVPLNLYNPTLIPIDTYFSGTGTGSYFAIPVPDLAFKVRIP